MAHYWFVQNSGICRPRDGSKAFLHSRHVGLIFALGKSKNMQECFYWVWDISPWPTSLFLTRLRPWSLAWMDHTSPPTSRQVEISRCKSWVRSGCLFPWNKLWVAYSGCFWLLWADCTLCRRSLLLPKCPSLQDSLLPGLEPFPLSPGEGG